MERVSEARATCEDSGSEMWSEEGTIYIAERSRTTAFYGFEPIEATRLVEVVCEFNPKRWRDVLTHIQRKTEWAKANGCLSSGVIDD